MDPNVKNLRKDFDISKKSIQASVHCCDRCGMTQEQLVNLKPVPRQLELHHIRSISSFVRAGITDPTVVNNRNNIQCLCTFCHTFWHKIAEPLSVPYQEFFDSEPAHLKFLK